MGAVLCGWLYWPAGGAGLPSVTE